MPEGGGGMNNWRIGLFLGQLNYSMILYWWIHNIVHL